MRRKRWETGLPGGPEAGWKGSYTVEAAFVIPLTFFVLAALLLCAFYVHDRTVFQSAACEIAAAGSSLYTEKERRAAMEERKQRITANRLLGSRGISSDTSLGKREAHASFSAEYPVPGLAVRYFSGGKLAVRESWSARREDPVKAIRLIRGAGKLLGNEG